MSPATTPINTPLSASKIITTLCLVVAAAGFGEGKSVCAQNEITGADGNKYWEVPGIQDGDTPEYMCLDHTLGSAMMVGAQDDFKDRIGSTERIFFGIGSFGPSGNMGKCYQMYLDNTGDDPTVVIGQVTNTGGDIDATQFDMQMGGGGFGVFNACAPTADYTSQTIQIDGEEKTVRNDVPCDSNTGALLAPTTPIPAPEGQENALFSGNADDWGQRCGGQMLEAGCNDLPSRPTDSTQADWTERNDLVQLCRYAFANKVRRTATFNEDGTIADGNPNHAIHTRFRIECPAELVGITNLQRLNDAAEVAQNEERFSGGVLTSTMDCCASAATASINTSGAGIAFVEGKDRLPSCDSTGYLPRV